MQVWSLVFEGAVRKLFVFGETDQAVQDGQIYFDLICLLSVPLVHEQCPWAPSNPLRIEVNSRNLDQISTGPSARSRSITSSISPSTLSRHHLVLQCWSHSRQAISLHFSSPHTYRKTRPATYLGLHNMISKRLLEYVLVDETRTFYWHGLWRLEPKCWFVCLEENEIARYWRS